MLEATGAQDTAERREAVAKVMLTLIFIVGDGQTGACWLSRLSSLDEIDGIGNEIVDRCCVVLVPFAYSLTLSGHYILPCCGASAHACKPITF